MSRKTSRPSPSHKAHHSNHARPVMSLDPAVHPALYEPDDKPDTPAVGALIKEALANLLATGAWRAAQAIEAAERTATEPQEQVQEFAGTSTSRHQSGILEIIRNER